LLAEQLRPNHPEFQFTFHNPLRVSSLGLIKLLFLSGLKYGNDETFADDVQRQFSSQSKTPNRGVKQAGFLVLRLSSMPSVLIESGFISNPTEANYLSSEEGQQPEVGLLWEVPLAVDAAEQVGRDVLKAEGSRERLQVPGGHGQG
jgi:hypothetical protein